MIRSTVSGILQFFQLMKGGYFPKHEVQGNRFPNIYSMKTGL